MNSSLLLADMNGFTPLAPTIEALGWTLLHFVWQGTAVALALACFLAISRRTSPRMRYAAGCAALMFMCLGAVATFAWQMAACNFRRIEQPAAERIVAVLPRVASPVRKDDEPGETASIPVPSFPIERDSSERTRPAQNASGEVEASAAPIARITPSELPTEPIWEPLRPWLSWIVGLWAGGVAFLALRLAAGWRVIRRLHSRGEKPKDPVWSARLDRLRVRLGVSSPVRLLSSATVPMVIGWLRPVVLVPAGLLTGLSVAQLEAVFAHELAHIRRHDYLVNLLQNVIETLFFYHPAAWWASQQVRSEREHCCDDLAAATCGGPLDYARALTALAELRHTSGALGLAATGGSLVGRMRRLAGIDAPGPRLGWPLPALVLAAGAVTALFAANASSRSDEAHNAVASGQRPVTGSVRGRLLDPWGKPVANATVWLAVADMKKHLLRGLPVVAHSRSTADGRFELAAGPSTVQQLADGAPIRFEIWTRKPGLALTCQVERDGLPDHPIEIRMKAEEPVSVRLRNPNGSPCSNAVVAPMSVQYGDERFLTIPEIIRNDLQVRSAIDGRVAFVGLTAEEIAELRFETSDFAAQCCQFPSREWPDSGLPDITLRKTGTLEGRLIAPAGLAPDLSRVKLHIGTHFNNTKSATVAWNEQVTVQSDEKGRFTVPKIAEGSVWIRADVPDDCDCRTDGFGYSEERPEEKLLITPDQTSKVEISMWKGVRATRRVRDAETKKPLPGVAVNLQHSNEWVQAKTDAHGAFAAWIRPDVAYQLSLELPIGYVRRNSASFDPVLVSSRAARPEMDPIELFRGRSIEGIVIDPAGQPFGGVRVGADWRLPGEEPANKRTAGVQARKWTTADTQGHFRFDDLVSGVEITLTPVRAEMVLADPLRVEPANDKPVRLRTGRFDFSVISGCVIDQSGYPVAGAEVVVQVLRPNETVNALRLRTDPFGRFKTPAYFPKQFEYRVTVRSRCQDVASSSPRRLSELNGQFPDLVIDQPDLVIDRPDAVDSAKLAGSDVVAIVNGEPIFASEVFERASATPLEPNGISLLVATKEMEAGRLREDEYRELQDTAIRLYLKDFIKSQLLSQTFIDNFDKARRQQIEEAVSKMFDEYVLKLEKDLQVSSRVEVDKKLRSQGTSLDGLKKEFRRRLLADEYLRSTTKAMRISREAMETYYQEHLKDYSSPEQVRWQLLEVSVRRHNGRKNARAVVEQAAADLRRGEDFASVVGKYSDGPGFEDGPDPLWTRLDNRADQELSSAMREMATGDVKPVFDDRASIEFRVGPQQGPNNALNLMQEGAKRLRKRESSEKVVRKYYADGGKQPWTNPASLADLRVSAVLGQLAVGETSSVLECSDSFRIVRLIDRRPAGRKSFDEVEPSIRRKLEKQLQEQTVDDLYHRSTIESPYFPEVQIHRANRASSGAMEMLPSGMFISPNLENRLDLPEKAPHRNCG